MQKYGTDSKVIDQLGNYGYIQTHTQNVERLLFLHVNNGYEKAPPYYIIGILPILFTCGIG